MQKKNMEPKAKLLEELVIDVKSVVKVNKGGRQRRFSATVVVGDRNGKVGLGTKLPKYLMQLKKQFKMPTRT